VHVGGGQFTSAKRKLEFKFSLLNFSFKLYRVSCGRENDQGDRDGKARGREAETAGLRDGNSHTVPARRIATAEARGNPIQTTRQMGGKTRTSGWRASHLLRIEACQQRISTMSGNKIVA
jgi:hypothetical protein